MNSIICNNISIRYNSYTSTIQHIYKMTFVNSIAHFFHTLMPNILFPWNSSAPLPLKSSLMRRYPSSLILRFPFFFLHHFQFDCFVPRVPFYQAIVAIVFDLLLILLWCILVQFCLVPICFACFCFLTCQCHWFAASPRPRCYWLVKGLYLWN